jgi:DtxR family Mn-dependent transcriptional regulator
VALSETVEEYLEKLYWFGEAGIEPTQANLARAMGVSQPTVTEMVRRLADDGLIERDERKRLHFTPEGDRIARHIVSRHRLIEAYLVQEFGIPWDEVHEEAHSFEHAISENLEQRMREKLADVQTCPHGHPIGDAPREPGEPLAGVPVGSAVRVLRLENEDVELLRLYKRTGVEPQDTIEVSGLGDETLRLATRSGEHELPLTAAQSVSVAVERPGDGPRAELDELGAAALPGDAGWGR